MLATYGNFVCLVDSTYNTTIYDVPLFALAVKTNVGFSYVASALIVDETSSSFVNVLTRLRTLNPTWEPSAFVTDFNEAQISALKAVFPGNRTAFTDRRAVQRASLTVRQSVIN